MEVVATVSVFQSEQIAGFNTTFSSPFMPEVICTVMLKKDIDKGTQRCGRDIIYKWEDGMHPGAVSDPPNFPKQAIPTLRIDSTHRAQGYTATKAHPALTWC